VKIEVQTPHEYCFFPCTVNAWRAMLSLRVKDLTQSLQLNIFIFKKLTYTTQERLQKTKFTSVY